MRRSLNVKLIVSTAFSMPSVNSVFPFLEGIRPDGDITWHIRRARMLEAYTSIWLISRKDRSGKTAIEFVTEQSHPKDSEEESIKYLLCLIPTTWEAEHIHSQIIKVCSSLSSVDNDCIKSWDDLMQHA